MYWDKRDIQELQVKEGLSMLDAQRKFLETKPKTRTQSHASTLCQPQGVDAITQTKAIPSQTKHSPTTGRSRTTVSCQTEAPTQTDDPFNPSVPGARIHLHL
jgi:hypothetical protein